MKRILLILVLLALLVNPSVIRSEGPWKVICNVQPEVAGYFVSLNGGPVTYVPKTILTLYDGSQVTLLMEVSMGTFTLEVVAYNYWGFSDPVFVSFSDFLPAPPPARVRKIPV